MPEPQQVTSKTVPLPNPLASDLEDLQDYAVNLFIEKLAISLGFAMLSAFIVFVSAMFNDVRFMTAFFRSIIAFFVSGVAAALISNVLDMQEDYYKMKSAEIAVAAEQAAQDNQNDQVNQNQQNADDSQNSSDQFKPFDKQNLPNLNNPKS